MIVPVDRAEARAMVAAWHSHHAPHVSEKLALGWMMPTGALVACVVAGRPIAGPLDQRPAGGGGDRRAAGDGGDQQRGH